MSGPTTMHPSATSTQVRRQGTNARLLQATRMEERAQARSRMVADVRSVSLKLGIAAAAVAALAAGGGWAWKTFTDPKWTGLEAIEVRGAHRLDPRAVATESGMHFGKGLLQVESARTRELLLNDPWILDVKVVRRWPHRVRLEVRERHPVARLSSERWISVDGTVLPRRGDDVLPLLSSQGFARGAVPRAVALKSLSALEGMSGAGLKEFDQARILAEGGLELSGEPGVPRILVRPEGWNRAMARWAALRAELGANVSLFSEIDLRHGSCAGLRRVEGGV